MRTRNIILLSNTLMLSRNIAHCIITAQDARTINFIQHILAIPGSYGTSSTTYPESAAVLKHHSQHAPVSTQG